MATITGTKVTRHESYCKKFHNRNIVVECVALDHIWNSLTSSWLLSQSQRLFTI